MYLNTAGTQRDQHHFRPQIAIALAPVAQHCLCAVGMSGSLSVSTGSSLVLLEKVLSFASEITSDL